MQNATVASVTPNLTTITDANVGSGAFTLTVVFSDAMDTTQNPTIAFPTAGEDPTASPATLTFNSGSWTDANTFVATYSVADQNVTISAVDVQVSGTKDTFGNASVASTTPDVFSVNTVAAATTSSISGNVYIDTNATGTHAGCPVISHVTVLLQQQNSTGQWQDWTTNPIEQTDGQGAYSFTNLPAGTYRVVESQPAMFSDGSPATTTVTLAAGTPQTGTDFTEPGVQPQYISLRMFLASAGSTSQVMQSLDTPPVVDLNGPAQSGNDATASVTFTPGGAAVSIAPPPAQIATRPARAWSRWSPRSPTRWTARPRSST